ncbi:MAG: J domain-containing protein [Acidobacteriota bacterium]|jgi:tetratricopeptide (TPR) repeat protein
MNIESGALPLRLVETLLKLHGTPGSCVVRVERGSSKKQLVISNGTLAFAESNLPDEHLAHILIRLNLLSRTDLKKVSAEMKSGRGSDDAIMLATGLDDKRMNEGTYEQAVTILASLFAWSGCELRIFHGDGITRRRCSLYLPLPLALVEAARRAARNHCVPASFQPLAGVVFANPNPGGRTNLPLNGAEAFAYAQVNGRTPIEYLLPALPAGAATPEEVIQCLLILGLLKLETAAPEQAISAAHFPGAQISEQMEELLRRFEIANLYEILSVPPDASDADIKSAYHEMAKQYHPDLFESKGCGANLHAVAEKLFTYITGAYTTLSVPAARANYDEMRVKKESRVEAAVQGRAAADSEKERMAETLYRAGRTSLIKGEFEKAVAQLRECVWLRPDIARFHHLLGVAQSEIVLQRKEAEQHLLKAIALDSMRPESLIELGKLYIKVSLPKRAEAQFHEALHIDPSNSEALRLLQTLRL